MDSPNEKKGKRPRIGQPRLAPQDNEMRDYINEQAAASADNTPRFREQRPYQQRQGSYNNYNNRYNNNYNNHYNNGGNDYRQPRRYNDPVAGTSPAENTEGTESEEMQRRPYHYNNNQGGYRRYDNQGGYNNQNRQGGYNSQHRQGGYNNQGRHGGYNNQGRQGGYNNQGRQGGYSNQNRQGGYNNQGRQGSYNNQNRQGGYNNQHRQGGYNNPNRGRIQHNEFGMPRGGKSFVPRPKRVEYEQSIPDPNEQIRLNKFMANAGICSRREADEYIQQGLVKVNGNVVTELGTKITHSDTVEYDDKLVALERKTYILLNKPKDCVTTSDDPNGRLTVMDLVKNACDERIYPVGRLDRNTTGVLLLTNDGDLASKLTHPKYVKKKIYHVWTDKDISEDDMQRIADGIELEDGPIHADAISYATDTDRNQAGIEIHSGRNRIVRRIFESLGYHVTKLDRVYFAGLTKKNLPRGRWRYLTQEEVNFLKMGAFE